MLICPVLINLSFNFNSHIWDFPGGIAVKNPPANARDPWVGKLPWRSKWQPTPVFLPGEFHGWRSLVGYSSWGHKESDTTEELNNNKSKKE